MNKDYTFPFERNPVIEAYKKGIDMTLIRESLKLTHEQRMLRLIELQKMAVELKKAGNRYRAQHD